ncbi:hypothetical protein MHYP_G00127230 [Metynnis hypsauchen]
MLWTCLLGQIQSRPTYPGVARDFVAITATTHITPCEQKDRLKRKYILPGCDETEIPARTKRWKKRKALIETNNLEIHQSFQDLPSAHDSSEVWSPLSDLSQSLSGTAEEVDNLMDYGDSDHDVENFSEDAHDAQHTTRLHDNCSDSTPRDRASPLFFEDESSTECDPHFNDLPNLSQSESSMDSDYTARPSDWLLIKRVLSSPSAPGDLGYTVLLRNANAEENAMEACLQLYCYIGKAENKVSQCQQRRLVKTGGRLQGEGHWTLQKKVLQQ